LSYVIKGFTYLLT